MMSQRIDPREVLTYLNELGYTNINAQQLKDFITDLKKLMKYENKHRHKENIEPVTPANTINTNPIDSDLKNGRKHCCDHPLCPSNQVNTSRDIDEQEDIFSHLYSQHTVASRAKEVPRKEKQISVHIRRPKSKVYTHEHCTHVGKQITGVQGDLQLFQTVETTSDGSKLYINTESTIKTIDPGSKHSITSKPSKKKSKYSLICPSVKSVKKSDPVALYHFYQEQWKKQKFPGQENHSDLRWAVRGKMMGGPKVDVHPVSSRRRCNSWKG